MNINWKSLRYYPYFHSIEKKYDLTSQQTMIFGYFYNHCINLNDNGFCGFSDERLSREMGLAYSTFKRELKILRQKDLLIVRNEGRRTRIPGESREIYLSSEPFLSDKQLSLEEVQIENKDRRIAQLEKQLSEALASQSSSTPNFWVQYLVDHDVLQTEEEIQKASHTLNVPYDAFANELGFSEMKKHLSYITNQLQRNEIKTDTVAYLSKALDQRFLQLRKWRQERD